MQRCRALVPLTRTLGRVQLQPSRSLYLRRPKLPALWNVASDMEQHFDDVRRRFDQLERELTSSWGLPSIASIPGRSASPMTMYESDLDGKYQMNIALGDRFLPENIKLSLKDRVLTVEAKYDHSSEDGTSRVHQEFTRQFTLPENVDPSQIKSLFTPDGILQIEAPLPVKEGEKPKEIPIALESSK